MTRIWLSFFFNLLVLFQFIFHPNTSTGWFLCFILLSFFIIHQTDQLIQLLSNISYNIYALKIFPYLIFCASETGPIKQWHDYDRVESMERICWGVKIVVDFFPLFKLAIFWFTIHIEELRYIHEIKMKTPVFQTQ